MIMNDAHQLFIYTRYTTDKWCRGGEGPRGPTALSPPKNIFFLLKYKILE